MTESISSFASGITGTGGIVGPLTQGQQALRTTGSIIGGIGSAASAFGSFATTVGGIAAPILQTEGIRRETEARAEARESQADILLEQAATEKIARITETGNKRRAAERFRGAQAAAFGKAGVALTGSALKVIEQTAEEQERDIIISRFESGRRQQRLEAEARQQQRLAQQERIAGITRVTQSLLTRSFG